jgi:DNA (cytosine-5)-methyltransferase 1
VKPLLLDLYCCEGGASRGYVEAGFDVVGVDLDEKALRRYPYPSVRADALEVLRRLIARPPRRRPVVVHASPPCQLDSVMSKAWNGRAEEHPDLIAPTRELLLELGVPYVIENVVGAAAKLDHPIMLCGSSFGLAVQRHRLFESNVPLWPLPCAHHLQRERRFPPLRSDRTELARVVSVTGEGGGAAKDVELWRWALGGIDWMSKHGLRECLPPAFTRYLGEQLLPMAAQVAA